MEQEEVERKKMDQINKAKAKLLQSGGSLTGGGGIDRVPGVQGDFMENMITSQANSIHHKGSGEVRVNEEQAYGMKDLKEKYDNLRSQGGLTQGLTLPDIHQKSSAQLPNSGPGADKSNLAIQRYQVIAKDPTQYEEGALVLHDHRLNGT